jgi:hypothetical protein
MKATKIRPENNRARQESPKLEKGYYLPLRNSSAIILNSFLGKLLKKISNTYSTEETLTTLVEYAGS